MRLTRRGRVAVVVVAVGVFMAWSFGPRSLNAVVASTLVALGAGAVQVRRLDRPSLERVVPDDGFVGESRRVALHLDADRPVTARMYDLVGDGLAATGNDATTTVGGRSVEYEVELTSRGTHAIGPLTVTVRDVLGLVERQFRYPEHDEVLAYPTVYDVTGSSRHELNLLLDEAPVATRGEFDALREYVRGDSLRDVHWRTSAKHPDDTLFVKEFVADADEGGVRIAAEGDAGTGDAMASGVASIATYLLDADVPVGVATPGGTVSPGRGEAQRTAILELLARTKPTGLDRSDREVADVLVTGGRDVADVSVDMGDRTVPFGRLLDGGRATAPRARVDGGVER